ncbi:MAG TPA: ABC transporter permease [Longimicrobium sp.]|jgi:putative ABC transport system permease protein
MDAFLQDLRFAIRSLSRAPAFALAAVATLALGIGANTAVFSLTNAVFLRPLPAERPQELVRLLANERGAPGASNPLSYPDYLDVAALRGVFAGVAASGRAEVERASGAPTRGQLVSGNYFTVLGVRPAVGRALLPSDDVAGAKPVAVVSHDLWTRELGGGGDVVGSELRLNGQAFTVVGVAPASFRGTDVEIAPDVWVPLAQQPLLRGAAAGAPSLLAQRGSHWLFPIARLAPGVTRDQASSALRVLSARLGAAYPETNREVRFRAIPGGTLVSAASSPEVLVVFILLSVVVAAVLAIACANVANLLLARAASRRREIAIRVSVGASRGRLVRQLLTESVLLALLGGAAGLALARAASRLFRLLELPPTLDFSTDGRVLAHSLAMSLATGILFGLAPALAAARGDTQSALRDGGAGTGRSPSRLRGALTVAQVALSLALLVMAGLLLRSVWALQAAPTPYDEPRIATAHVEMRVAEGDTAAARAALLRLLEAVRRTPGVEAAAFTQLVPMGGSRVEEPFSVPGAAGGSRSLDVNVVSGDYFATMGMRASAGRTFEPRDRAGGAPVAVVSRALARSLWPGQNPIGKRLRAEREGRGVVEVVGVVDDVSYARHAGLRPLVYLPWEQSIDVGVALQVRARGDAAQVVEPVRRAARVAGVELVAARTLSQMRRDAAFPQRLTGTLLSIFGAVALALASVGVYGVVAYGVAQRTREIGVRIALGARPGDVSAMVVAGGARLAAIGVAVGVAIALGASQLLSTLLFGVGAADPLTYGGVAALLLGMTLLATWIPARRASRVDPMVALRSE